MIGLPYAQNVIINMIKSEENTMRDKLGRFVKGHNQGGKVWNKGISCSKNTKQKIKNR